MRFLDNVLAGLYRRAEPGHGARRLFGDARAVGRPRRDGLPQLPEARGLAFEGAMAKSWNLKMFKHIKGQVDEASMQLAIERGPCPDAADMGRDGALQLQDGDRADRVDQHHLRRHHACIEPIRPTSIPTRRSAVRVDPQPYLEKMLIGEIEGIPMRCGIRSSSRAAACSISISSARDEKIASRPASRSTSAG